MRTRLFSSYGPATPLTAKPELPTVDFVAPYGPPPIFRRPPPPVTPDAFIEEMRKRDQWPPKPRPKDDKTPTATPFLVVPAFASDMGARSRRSRACSCRSTTSRPTR